MQLCKRREPLGNAALSNGRKVVKIHVLTVEVTRGKLSHLTECFPTADVLLKPRSVTSREKEILFAINRVSCNRVSCIRAA